MFALRAFRCLTLFILLLTATPALAIPDRHMALSAGERGFQTAAAGAQPDCFHHLGAIGLLCRVPGPGPTIEVWGIRSDSTGHFLLRVTQPQVDAARPAGQVAATDDGRVSVRVGQDEHITFAMGPDAEGKVYHVTLAHTLHGRVIGTAETPGHIAPAAAGLPVYRQRARADGAIIHTVRPGQTLFAISLAYQVPLQQLIDRNGLAPGGDRLYAGQALVIRAAPRDAADAAMTDECGLAIHVVQRGDSVMAIARARGVHPAYLAIRNQLTEGGRWIYPGQQLVMPGTLPRGSADCDGALRHVVRSGHTLYSIAVAWGADWRELVALNRLADGGRRLYPGQVLLIRPAGDGAPAGG